MYLRWQAPPVHGFPRWSSSAQDSQDPAVKHHPIYTIYIHLSSVCLSVRPSVYISMHIGRRAHLCVNSFVDHHQHGTAGAQPTSYTWQLYLSICLLSVCASVYISLYIYMGWTARLCVNSLVDHHQHGTASAQPTSYTWQLYLSICLLSVCASVYIYLSIYIYIYICIYI